jgi:mannose-1-phosphate guanylyltransferase
MSVAFHGHGPDDPTPHPFHVGHPFGATPADDLSDVCGIVLAGSYHWGDGPFERVHRGPTLPVAQTPIIFYPLTWLRRGGVRETVVCANSSTPDVRRLVGDGTDLGLAVSYLEDLQPRGPAGCASDATRLAEARTYIVVEGSLIPSLDLRTLVAAHRRAGAAATTVVEVDRRHKGVRGEQRRMGGGIYVFERRILEEVAAVGYQDIKEGLLKRLHARGETVLPFEIQGVTPRVIDGVSYAAVSSWLVGAAAERPDLMPYSERVGEGRHHRSAMVHPDARIIGPVLLGPGVRVEADAVIVGPTSIGAGTTVQAGAVVARSIIWERCTVGRGARLDASFLGNGEIVRAGERLSREQRLGEQSADPVGAGPAPALPPRDEPRSLRTPVRLPADFTLGTRRDAERQARV